MTTEEQLREERKALQDENACLRAELDRKQKRLRLAASLLAQFLGDIIDGCEDRKILEDFITAIEKVEKLG